MEPIIAPSFFYWIEVFEAIKILSIVIGTLGPIGVIGLWCEYHDGEFGALLPTSMTILWFIFLCTGIFLPSKSTLIKMKVAEYVTKDNVKVVMKYISDIKDETKDDVIDVIKALKEEEGE